MNRNDERKAFAFGWLAAFSKMEQPNAPQSWEEAYDDWKKGIADAKKKKRKTDGKA